jgi:hypothetical protein
MPFYQIIILLKSGETVKGVRENQNMYIERVWDEYHSLAFKSYGQKMDKFSCLQVSKNSKIYKDYIKAVKKTDPPGNY